MRLPSWTSWRRAGALATLASAAWPAVALASTTRPNWHPGGPFSPITTPGSSETLNISNLFWGVLVLSGVIFALVSGMLLYAIIKYSAKDETTEPRQIFGNRNVEILWTVIPTVIL